MNAKHVLHSENCGVVTFTMSGQRACLNFSDHGKLTPTNKIEWIKLHARFQEKWPHYHTVAYSASKRWKVIGITNPNAHTFTISHETFVVIFRTRTPGKANHLWLMLLPTQTRPTTLSISMIYRTFCKTRNVFQLGKTNQNRTEMLTSFRHWCFSGSFLFKN